MNQTNKKKQSEFTDLSIIFSYYIKYWKWFLISVILTLSISVFYLLSKSPIYGTISNILIKTEDSRSASMSSTALKSLGFAGLSSSESIDDEVQVLSSHTLIRKMISELELYKIYTLKKFPFKKSLYNNSPIIVEIPEEFIDTLTSSVIFKVNVEKEATTIKAKFGKEELGEFSIKNFPQTITTDIGKFTFKINDKEILKTPYQLEIIILSLDYAAEVYMDQTKISSISKRSNMIGLYIQDENTQRAKDILNSLIRLYNVDALSDKNKMAQNTIVFIEDRINYINKDLQLIESDIELYKKSNNIVDASTEVELFLKNIGNIQDKSVEYEIQSSLIEMLEEFLNNSLNKYSLIPISSSMPDGISESVKEYNNAILERTRLLRNTNENNPIIQTVNEQIDLLKKNVDLSIKNIRKEISMARKDWEKKEQEIQSKIGEMPRQEREFLEKRRQQQIKSELYIFLLQKLQEAELSLASSTPKAKIVDSAYTITVPIAPKKSVILVIGLFIGIIIPILVIWIKDLFKVKLSNIQELERYTQIPILGEICKDKSGNKIVVSETSVTSITELFRLIRANLQFILTKKEEKVILVTSSMSGEGKSFFVINLALSLSLIKGKKVAIVGLDIRNPKISEYMSIKSTKGITTYLSSEDYTPEDVILTTELHPDLSVVPAGPIPPNPSELLLSDRLDSFFDYLRLNFDYIIVDSAPVGMVSDTFTLDRISDATIYLYRADYTNKSYLKLADNIIAEDKLKKVSLVINGTTTKSGYGYGYGSKK